MRRKATASVSRFISSASAGYTCSIISFDGHDNRRVSRQGSSATEIAHSDTPNEELTAQPERYWYRKKLPPTRNLNHHKPNSRDTKRKRNLTCFNSVSTANLALAFCASSMSFLAWASSFSALANSRRRRFSCLPGPVAAFFSASAALRSSVHFPAGWTLALRAFLASALTRRFALRVSARSFLSLRCRASFASEMWLSAGVDFGGRMGILTKGGCDWDVAE